MNLSCHQDSCMKRGLSGVESVLGRGSSDKYLQFRIAVIMRAVYLKG